MPTPDPFAWRPLDELDHQNVVEFRIPGWKEDWIVTGFMLIGGVHPKARSCWYRRDGNLIPCSPTEFRELPPGIGRGTENSEPAPEAA